MSTQKTATVNCFRIAFDGETAGEAATHKLLRRIIRMRKRSATIGEGEILLGNYERRKIASSTLKAYVGQLRRLRPNDRVAEGDA
ncbi:MAG: hypothetical protein ACIAXF_06070, partial [Phycisphaerales bacterium JB063]